MQFKLPEPLEPMHHAMDVLEFGKVIENIAKRCLSDTAREMVRKLTPLSDVELIRTRQELVEEMRQLLAISGQPELAGLSDARMHVDKALKEGVLNEEQLWEIASCSKLVHRLTRILPQRERFPRLRSLLDGLENTPSIHSNILRFIEPPGVFKEDASERLTQLRIAKKEVHDRLQERLSDMLVEPKYADYWQETLITLRNERFVLPLKAEHKQHLPSVIHDRSASGATVFVEPIEIVPLNNQLRELELEEREEKLRVLRNLSGIIASYANQMLSNIQILYRLDFLTAISRFADELHANPPAVDENIPLRIVGARHPMLIIERGYEAVVPLDVEIMQKAGCILITGPNMGGKTVALKTIGILSLMATCGLPVPAEARTQIPIFERFFADIGDEQSVEASISSFASHISHYTQALRNAGKKSLVLLDELGSATDPQEGTPLSWALIEGLLEKGAMVIANTHLGGLLGIESTRSDVINAAMEFDQNTMVPTYRMISGIPGRSWAAEIAGMLGFPEDVLKRARELSRGGSALDEIIKNLQAKLNEVQDMRNRLSEERMDMRGKREVLEGMIVSNRMKEKEVDRMRRVYDEQRESRIAAAVERELEKMRLQWEKIILDSPPPARKRKNAEDFIAQKKAHLRRREKSIARRRGLPKNLEKGQRVFIYRLRKWAEVLEQTDEQGFVRVLAGDFTLRIHSSGVDTEDEYEKKRRKRKSHGAGKDIKYTQRESPQTIDVRGNFPEDAWNKIDHILDDAVSSDTPQILIIHGKGRGVLRRIIRDRLREDRRIYRIKLPDERQGGDGATIAILREDEKNTHSDSHEQND